MSHEHNISLCKKSTPAHQKKKQATEKSTTVLLKALTTIPELSTDSKPKKNTKLLPFQNYKSE